MPEVKVRTDKEYGNQFCVIMNTDEKLTAFINDRLGTYMNDYAAATHKAFSTRDVKAGGDALHKSRGDIMSLMAFIYGKARVKEEEMKD